MYGSVIIGSSNVMLRVFNRCVSIRQYDGRAAVQLIPD